MTDVDNRIKLLFHIAYSRLAEKGIISDEELERLGELLDNLDSTDEAALQKVLESLGKAAQS